MSSPPDDSGRRGGPRRPSNDPSKQTSKQSASNDSDDDFADLFEDSDGSNNGLAYIPSEGWMQQYEPWDRTPRVWDALLETHPDRFYVYDDRLCEAIPASKDRFKLGRMQEVSDRDLMWAADCAKIGKRHSEKDGAKKNERLSKDDFTAVRAGAKDCGVPEVKRTWHCPFVSGGAEGRIIGTGGYDAETQIFLFWNQEPVLGDADEEKARRHIDGLLDTFAWASNNDRAHALGLLMMPFLRPAIPEATPLHVVWSKYSGSGKTHFVKVMSTLLGARSTHTLSSWGSEGERQLSEALLKKPELMFFDNVPGDALMRDEAASLLSALTATPEDPYNVRQMGGGQRATLVDCIWAATPRAGRIPFGEEMKRRVIPIELLERHHAPAYKRHKAKQARLPPDERKGYAGAGIDFIEKNRTALINDFLTLLMTWLDEGAPGPAAASDGERDLLGSFSAWDRAVGGAVEFIWPELKGCWMNAAHRPKSVDDEDLMDLAQFWLTALRMQNEGRSPDSAMKWEQWMTAEAIGKNCSLSGIGLVTLGAHMGARTIASTLARLAATDHIVDVPGFGRHVFTRRKSSRVVYGFKKL